MQDEEGKVQVEAARRELIMRRWIMLLESMNFILQEHQQKAEQYGDEWSSAFQKELDTAAESITQRFTGAEDLP